MGESPDKVTAASTRAPLQLQGSCNRCGLCCAKVDPVTGAEVRCAFLATVNGAPLGRPGATFCTMRRARIHYMPVPLITRQGELVAWSHCAAHGTKEETDTIIERGLGRGCSLTLAPA